VFLLLVIYSFGIIWATFMPKRYVVEGTRFERLGPVLHFINPGKFQIKEVRLLYSFLRAFQQAYVTEFAARHR
jgi:hypothetical protein